MYMKKAQLRLCSGPFDWLTHGHFLDRMNLLLSDFEDFMNPDYFRPLQKNKDMFNDDKCDYYENFKAVAFFFHDFPTGIPFDESFPQVKEKYERRIDRFWKNIKKNKNVLLIWFSHDNETEDAEIIRLCNLFCQKIGKTVDFLIIENNKNNKVPQKRQLLPNIIKWTLITEGVAPNENPTLGNELQIQPIFNDYTVNIPVSILLRKIGIKLLCYITPVHKWRKKLRNLYRQ